MWIFIEAGEPQYPEMVVCNNQEELEEFFDRVTEENNSNWSRQEVETLLTSLDNDAYRVGWFSLQI
jgi:ubiquitin C-terminal hydrolase